LRWILADVGLVEFVSHYKEPATKATMADAFTIADSLKDRKGDQVSLRGGSLKTHKGYIAAWKDRAKAPMDCYTYIIIEKNHPKKAGKKYLQSYRVTNTNFNDKKPANTYFTSVSEQVQQLTVRLDSLALMAAKCRVKADCTELHQTLTEAVDKHAHKLVKQGANAEYKNIMFDEFDDYTEETMKDIG
jgi:predicted SnoaL-like aldol condensation-catalyzing enzyme